MLKTIKLKTKLILKFWLPFFIWMSIIFTFSANPTVKTSEIHWQDFILKKTAHLVEYFAFSLLLYRAIINSGYKSKNIFTLIILAAFLYGLIDEFHQSFVPGREPKIRDVLIDTAGAVLFTYVMKKVILKKEKLLYLAKMIQLVD